MKKHLLPRILSCTGYVFAMTLGAIFCLITAFSVPVDPIPLGLVCLSLALLFTVFLSVRRGWIELIVVFALLTAALVLRWEECVGAFLLTADCIAPVYSAAFSLGKDLVIPTDIPAALSANAFFIILSVFLAFFCADALARRHCAWLCFPAALPPLIAGLVILETTPATWAELLLIGALALAALTQSVRRSDADAAARLSTVLLLPLAALCALLVAIEPPELYARSAWSDSLQGEVSTVIEKLSVFRLNERTGQMEFVSPFSPSTLGSQSWDSSVERVNLSRVGPQGKTGRHVMSVYAPVNGVYHLRANSLAVYENNSWRALSDDAYAGISVPDSVFLNERRYADGAIRTVTVKTDMKSSIYYLPYRPVEFPSGAEPYTDAYVRNRNQETEYSIDYTSETSHYETSAAYQDFVHENYTQLPDDVTAALDTISAVQLRNSGLAEGGINALNYGLYADAVAELVQEGKTYSLDTPRVPEGEDFAIWFLTQSDTGYCVHFATAAAVILRYWGIPARYVTGYYVSARQDQWTAVTEDEAHAWTEYYVDGVGWKVLDATPASFAENVSEPDTLTQTPEEQPSAPGTSKPDETGPTQEPNEPQTPAQSDRTGSQSTAALPDANNETARQGRGGLLTVVLGILAFAGAWFAYRVLRLSGRAAQLQHGQINRRAVMYFRHLCFLSKLAGETPEPELEEIALKARFSQHRITPEELSRLSRRCDELTRQLMQTKNLWKRFLYRMVYVIA